jgi:hypothetical protein
MPFFWGAIIGWDISWETNGGHGGGGMEFIVGRG